MKKFRKFLKWLTLFLTGGIGLILALPYLIPLKPTLDYSHPSFLYPNSKIEKINDVYVHYRVFEPETTKKGNVLMIHGFAGSTFSWRKNIDTLTQNGYQVVCMDLPNFGFSERKLDWNHSPENRARLAWELTEKIIPNENWHLIGHSMGASVILAMGQMNPEKVLSLICVDGLFFSSNPHFVSHLLLNSHYVHRIGEILLQRYFTKPERFKKILASAYGQTPEEEALNGYLKPLTVKDTAKGILVMSAQNSNFQIDYSKIWNKMFLIWGEKDTWIPIQTAKKFQEKYTDIPLKIIPETGHCPMETHSKEFNSLVVELMNKR